jgi:sporulation protein YlmC with PRC-barrel domain
MAAYRESERVTGRQGMPIAMTCDKISGMDVINPQGQDLGEIADVMLDLRSGKIIIK